MEEEKIIKLLKYFLKTKTGRVSLDILTKEFPKENIDFCRTCEFIGYDSMNKNYFLWDNGFNFLNQNSISKNTKELNKIMKTFKDSSDKNDVKMEGHTKTMKILTWFILGFTILNFVSILIQINLSSKQSQSMENLTRELINYVNTTVDQGETQIALTGNVAKSLENMEGKLSNLAGEVTENEENEKTKLYSSANMSLISWISLIVGIILIGVIFWFISKREIKLKKK